MPNLKLVILALPEPPDFSHLDKPVSLPWRLTDANLAPWVSELEILPSIGFCDLTSSSRAAVNSIDPCLAKKRLSFEKECEWRKVEGSISDVFAALQFRHPLDMTAMIIARPTVAAKIMARIYPNSNPSLAPGSIAIATMGYNWERGIQGPPKIFSGYA
jgi:hypothetical protein